MRLWQGSAPAASLLPRNIFSSVEVTLWRHSITANICGEVDNSYVFTVSFPSFSVRAVAHTFSYINSIKEKNEGNYCIH